MLYLVGQDMGGKPATEIERSFTLDQIELAYYFISRRRVRDALTQRAVMTASITEALGRMFGGT